MSKHTPEPADVSTLAEDARELLSATVGMAGEKISEARHRVSVALEKAKKGVRATDKAIHQNPYKAIGLAVGAGLLVGYFLGARCAQKDTADK